MNILLKPIYALSITLRDFKIILSIARNGEGYGENAGTTSSPTWKPIWKQDWESKG